MQHEMKKVEIEKKLLLHEAKNFMWETEDVVYYLKPPSFTQVDCQELRAMVKVCITWPWKSQCAMGVSFRSCLHWSYLQGLKEESFMASITVILCQQQLTTVKSETSDTDPPEDCKLEPLYTVNELGLFLQDKQTKQMIKCHCDCLKISPSFCQH